MGSFQQAFYGGRSPWQYEALFVSRAERGLVSAPNMAVGLPFNIGITAATASPLAAVPEVPGPAAQPYVQTGAHAGYPGA